MSGDDEEKKMGDNRYPDSLLHFNLMTPHEEKTLPESLLMENRDQRSDLNLRAIHQRNTGPEKGQLMLHIIRRAKKRVPANNDLLDVAASINIRGYNGPKETKSPTSVLPDPKVASFSSTRTS